MKHRLNEFKCPLCQAPLHKIALNVSGAIHAYNNAASALEQALRFTGSELN